jgi:hypothetical protein
VHYNNTGVPLKKKSSELYSTLLLIFSACVCEGVPRSLTLSARTVNSVVLASVYSLDTSFAGNSNTVHLSVYLSVIYQGHLPLSPTLTLSLPL